jgi:hypothetical protein
MLLYCFYANGCVHILKFVRERWEQQRQTFLTLDVLWNDESLVDGS